jgi:hypothetical protein
MQQKNGETDKCNYCDQRAIAHYRIPNPTIRPISGKVGEWSNVYLCSEHETAVKRSAPYSQNLNYVGIA